MTEEQIHRARSIIAYAAENSSETEEVILLGWAIKEIEALKSQYDNLLTNKRLEIATVTMANLADVRTPTNLTVSKAIEHAEHLLWRLDLKPMHVQW